MIVLIRKDQLNKLVLGSVIAVNSILFCWIALPFNFISQIQTSKVNHYVDSFPDGYPFPEVNQPVQANIFSDSTGVPVYGYPNFYSKRITIQDHIITPTMNRSYEEFNADKTLRRIHSSSPFVYLNDTSVTIRDSTIGTIRLVDFTPNKFKFIVNAQHSTMLTLFQQFNSNWKISVNNESRRPELMCRAFMGTNVPKGESEVIFEYRPTKVIFAVYLSIITIIPLLALNIFFLRRTKI